MVAVPFSKGQIHFVDVIGEILAFGKIASADTGDWNESHHGPIADEQRDAENEKATRFEIDESKAGEQVTEGDSLQDSEKANVFVALFDAAVGE